jgi:hypothetical protein
MRIDELRRELAMAIQDQPGVQPDARRRVQRRVRHQRSVRGGLMSVVLVAVLVAGVSILRRTDDGGRVSTAPGFRGRDMPARVVAVTTDGRLVVVRSSDGHVIRQLATEAVVDPQGPNGETPNITVTPDGNTVYFMSLYNRFNGATISSVPLAGGPVTNVFGQGCCGHYPAVSPDGRWLAYSGVPDRSDAGSDILLLDLTISHGPNSAIYTRRWTTSTPLRTGVGPLAWADAQHLAFLMNDVPNPGSPRVLDTNAPESTRLDQLPAVTLPDGRPGGARWAGYRGNTGEMLGLTGANSQVLATDPKPGAGIHLLFTLPGATTPAADQSGDHIVLTAREGLYIWSQGDASAHKIADGITGAVWVPKRQPDTRLRP